MKTKWILLLFLPGFCSAQNFGKAGTVWQHCYLEEFGSSPLIHDYIEVQSLNDTMVQNLQCHELVLTHEPREFGTNKSIVICNDNDKVYYLENDSLHLVYNFSLGIGETYLLRYPIEFDTSYLYNHPNFPIYFNIRIDSVSIVNVNGQLLKKQHLTVDNTGNSLIYFGKYAIEKIGYEFWMLPSWECFVCERHVFEGLNSFKDFDISYQDPNSICRLSNVSSINKTSLKIALFPDPAADHISIENTQEIKIQSVYLFDLSGKSVPFETEKSSDKLLLRFHLNPGLYFIKLRLANGELVHTKFITRD